MVLSQLKKKYGITESSKTTENEQNTNQKTSTLEDLKNKYSADKSHKDTKQVYRTNAVPFIDMVMGASIGYLGNVEPIPESKIIEARNKAINEEKKRKAAAQMLGITEPKVKYFTAQEARELYGNNWTFEDLEDLEEASRIEKSTPKATEWEQIEAKSTALKKPDTSPDAFLESLSNPFGTVLGGTNAQYSASGNQNPIVTLYASNAKDTRDYVGAQVTNPTNILKRDEYVATKTSPVETNKTNSAILAGKDTKGINSNIYSTDFDEDANSAKNAEAPKTKAETEREKYYANGIATYDSLSVSDRNLLYKYFWIKQIADNAKEITDGYVYTDGNGEAFKISKDEYKSLESQYESLITKLNKEYDSEDIERMQNTLAAYANEVNRAESNVLSAKYATLHPTMGTVLSIGGRVVGGIPALADVAFQNISNIGKEERYVKPVDYNTALGDVANMGNTMRGTISQNIRNSAGSLAGFLYDVSVSAAESPIRALPGANVALFAASAYDGIAAAAERGASDSQALFVGSLQAAFEAYLEKKGTLKSLADLQDIPITDIKDLAKVLIASPTSEALEEALTEVGQKGIDLIVAAISGDVSTSEYGATFEKYRNNGESVGDAFLHTMQDAAIDVGLSALGGFISGAEMSGPLGVLNYASNRSLSNVKQYYLNSDGKLDTEKYNDLITRAYKSKNDSILEYAKKLSDKRDGVQASEAALLHVMLDTEALASGSENKKGPLETQYTVRSSLSDDAKSAFDYAMQEATDKEAAAEQFRIKYLEGATGKAFEVDTESELTSVMQEAAYKYGAEAAKAEAEKGFRAITSSYGEAGKAAYEAIISGSRSVSASNFMEMHNAYTAGLSGIDMPKAKTLSNAELRTLYQAGQKDAKASLKAEKGAVGSRVIRKDAGLTQDAYTAKMNKSTVKQLDSVLKALGLKGMFVDSVKGGKANAEIRNDGTILLAKDMENPIRTVIGHEITHRMQELAPKEYRAFRDAVMKELGESRDGRIVSTLLRYKQAGVDLNSEAAMDEIAADYAGMLMEDGKLLDEFIERHKENRTLLERFLDAVRAIIAKLTGADKARLQTVESKLMKALEASAKVAEKNAGKTKHTTDSGVKYEIKTDENGRRYVQLDREFSLEGTDPELWEKQVFDYINEKIRNGEDILLTSEDGHLILLTERSAYKLSDRHIPKIGKAADKYLTNEEYALKTRIASHIDEVIEVSRFVKWREDVDGKHENDIGEDGFNYFVAWVRVPEDKGYYRVTFSSALYESEETMYSIAKPRKRGTIGRWGSSGDAGAQSDQGASTTVYTTESKKSQEKSSAAIAFEKFLQKNPEMAESLGIEADAETDSVAPSGRFSLKTWNDSDYVTARNTAAKEIAEAIGVSQRKARDYIDSVNSIAKLIADDIDRLDYTASDGVSVFVSNAEYGGSIDMSTLCPKRAIMSGTFSAIQKALPNTALTAAEILEIRKKMADKGLEVSCGCCYVEGSRAAMGGFAKEFINLYSKYYPSRWIPNMVDVNTPDGVEIMRIEHPEAYEQYEYFWNHYGTLREGDKKLFASQQKPKLFQARTAYNGDILKHFSKESSVTEKNKNGGLRIQSFSDFEIVHLIDMMQVIMDMSRVGLAGQAYTKVPDFAWALGDTGLKINLSLISKGLDENGNLIFDPREGMSIEDAMELRERYSQNVGTILVVFSDAELKAAMADDRVDFIIPFHRSQWKKSQYATLGLPAYTKDYTNQQNEKLIKKTYHEYRGRMVPDKAKNFVPSDYWDYNKSGKENAEAYLDLCAKNNKRPKFYKLLVDNGNGTYSLQPDGSTDGYWKLLIDYKMYDNDGIGSPQKPVSPIFNMQESERMLNEYKGGHSQFPVAYDIVDEFVAQYKAEHPSTKYSLKGKDMYQTEYEAVMREAQEQGLSTEEVKERIRGVNEKVLNALVKEYGAIKPGERPSRVVTLPKKTSEGKNVSRTVRTVMEAEATPDEMIPTLEQMVADGEFSYDTITDKGAIAKAEDKIAKHGFDATVRDWFKAVGSGKVSKDNTALGWTIYNNAANSGDTELAIDVLCEMVKHQRNAAQALQATRILKKLSPSGQLYAAQKNVQGLQEELEERYGDKAPELKIDTALAEKVINGKTEAERRNALADLYRDIGRQMPSTVLDKWNAWRYLSMLGNARTHIRNIVGNAGFAPVVTVKNIVATGIESLVGFASGGKMGRTKAFLAPTKADRALIAAAWEDYNAVADAALGQSKYSDNQFANKYIEEGRRIFKFKPLEAARRGNSWLLDKEDSWFSKPQYANAFAQYCKANGITAEQIKSGKGLEKARAYAIKEAQKATYRDTNAFSELFSKLGRIDERGEHKLAKRIWNRGVEGVLPFRKTPANILARGIEYSPIGLAVGVKNLLFDVKSGKATAAEVIDKMSAGLTGTGLMALGAFLVSQGVLRGFGGDDEKEKEYMELMGHQQYALEIGGTSITLDWLAPEALPFFVGANIAEQTMQDGEMTVEGLVSALGNISDPMLSMSCLQGLNDLIESVSFSDTSGIVTIAASAATSYLTQGIPTLFGQIERTSESERMMTYTSKGNKTLTPDMQYTLGKVSAKIPGDYSQIPYIDAWGRTEPSGSVGARAFNNMLNPSYTSTIKESPMEKELLRLYEQTGESVLPSRADKSFPIGGEQVYLTAEQYQKYATSKGKRSYRILTALTKSDAYNSFDDFTKAEVVSKVYTYSNAIAKSSCGAKNSEGNGYALDGWVSKAYDACTKYGIDEEIYIAAYVVAGNAGKYVNDGETVDNSPGLCTMQAVYAIPGLSQEQYDAMFVNFGVGSKVRGYDKKTVERKIAEFEKEYERVE